MPLNRYPTVSACSSVICAPIFTHWQDLSTQVAVGPAFGLKRESSIHCDGLMSLEKTKLTDFVWQLDTEELRELDVALIAALGVQIRNKQPVS